MAKSNTSTARRKARVRRAIVTNAGGRPRLSVFRSSKQIYAQVIDDQRGRTIVAASSIEKAMREEAAKLGGDAAVLVYDRTQRMGMVVTGGWWVQYARPVYGRVIVAVAIKYKR